MMQSAKDEIERNGFAALRGLFSDHDIRIAEKMLDALMLEPTVAFVSHRRELSENSGSSGPLQPEFARATSVMPALKQTTVYLKCEEIASVMLGARPHYLFDHAIYKMPHSNTITPWHQDQAYLGTFMPIRSLHFWIPFQDTGTTSGCLRFVAGSHKAALLPHVAAYASNAHVLTIGRENDLQAVDLPLALGDVSVHTNLTLHSAGPNRSDTTRKAWIVHFGNKPRWFKHLMKVGRLGNLRWGANTRVR